MPMVKSEPAAGSSSQVPHVSLPKRKKTEDLDQPVSASKKKPRTRVSYSCGECHRRKQKCDRQIPCSHVGGSAIYSGNAADVPTASPILKCIARKVPELCKAYTPGKSEQDVHARLSRLEQIIEIALPQYCGQPFSGPSSPLTAQGPHHRMNGSASMSPDDDGSQGDEGDIGVGSFDGGGRYYGKSVSGSVAPVTMLEQLTGVGSSREGRGRGHYIGHSISPLRPNTAEEILIDENESASPMLQSAEPSAADLLQSLIRDCGLTEDKLHEFMQELPDRHFTDQLINYYFKNMNWTRYPISEQDFRQSYTALLENGCVSNPSSIRFLPLLFVVLATSVRLSPEHIGGDARERRLKSMRYYWASRRALLIAAAIQPDSLEMVLTRLLSARYLTFDRRITECWSQLGAAVCTAQALGLHRDAADMRLEPAQVEYRRRIWAYLYHADRSYSMVLGRPYAIQDEYTTTLPPFNVEDLNAITSSPSVAPLTTPTRMSFVILRHGLAYLIGKMVHYFQRVRIQNHYSEVLALDDDLQRFIDTLPPHFSFNPDTSKDRVEEYIPLHRYLLTTEILFVRISLHRPYILRRVGTDRYARSRRACFESALMDFKVREAYRKTQSKDILRMVSNAYREFQTAMMSGIYLVLEPHGRDAAAMHTILETFLKDHNDMSLEVVDETTRREVKIIEFLRNKALQAETKNGIRPSTEALLSPAPEQNKDAQANANLLLSLQQSHDPRLQHSRPSSDGAATLFQRLPTSGPNMPTPMLTNTGPSIVSSMPQSPTFQRVQAQSTNPSARHSPIGSGSPGADEDLSAQHMLDHWCNTVTNPLPMPIDSFANGGSSLTSGQWGTFSTGVTGNVADWLNTPYILNNDSGMTNGLEGADYNYWESLVNTIRGGPTQ